MVFSTGSRCGCLDFCTEVARIPESGVLQTIFYLKINDFVDGPEYYAVFDAGCSIIITEDKDDFWFSEIEVLDCEGFIALLRRRGTADAEYY
jgi:hypothetical protein